MAAGMGLWGKAAGLAAGLALGGPIGGLIGAAAGHLIDRQWTPAREEDREQQRQAQRQVAFTMGVIALGAKMAKADGHVSPDEVRAFKEVFRVPEEEMRNVARVFDLAKQDVAGYDAYARQLADLFADDPPLLVAVLEGLFHIASADRTLHEKEDAFLADVAHHFHIPPAQYARIRARFVGETKEDPYAVLGIARDASDADVQRRWKKLVIENHPDKAIARGVPPEFVRIATEKLAGINAAYDAVKRERGLS
jgi:DnaJ like chaperone protein